MNDTAAVPVLMYHEIAEATETGSRLAVEPAAFAAQLGYLRAADFTTVTAGELSAWLDGHGQPLPDRPVVLTFDDGYADFHQRALPLLRQHDFTATLFVTTGWHQDGWLHAGGSNRMLTRTQIAEVAAAGVEIGAHTRRHRALDQLPRHAVHEELVTSKHWLEDQLGRAVPGLAYPFGYSSAEVRDVAREAGYGYAYAVGNQITGPASEPFARPRLTVRRATTLPEFRRLADGHIT
ncbi:MAG TPA: polysaccharide deacetylase family protein, partial [Trebonia sp.]|nr:polysaccharide deacetylase family protein [Trebonia sp.]